MILDVSVNTAEGMGRFGERFARFLRAGDLVVLSGPLGAGKTTFTRGLGAGLGVRGSVTSPTFVIARTHPSTRGGPPLVHVDAYRVASPLELDDLDIDYARSIVVVEWGAGMVDGVAESWVEVGIERPAPARGDVFAGSEKGVVDAECTGDEVRRVRVRGVGSRWEDESLVRDMRVGLMA